MFEVLKKILLNSEYVSSREFKFPRQSGTTTLLTNLATHFGTFYGKVLYVYDRNFDIPTKNYDVVSANNFLEYMRGKTYDYYIFDNCLEQLVNKQEFPISFFVKNRYVSVDTV